MRKKNSIAEFSSERSELLLKNFRISLAQQSQISIAKAFHFAANSPAPRFWVSEIRALKIIRRLLKGEDALEGMNPEKREMYLEIFRRVKDYKQKYPEMPLGDIVFEVVNSPAPKSYLSISRTARIVKYR